MVDSGDPQADQIHRTLTKDKLLDGIETLLEMAKLEHWDVALMKHLVEVASFAKKFTYPSDLDPSLYVNNVSHVIAL